MAAKSRKWEAREIGEGSSKVKRKKKTKTGKYCRYLSNISSAALSSYVL